MSAAVSAALLGKPRPFARASSTSQNAGYLRARTWGYAYVECARRTRGAHIGARTGIRICKMGAHGDTHMSNGRAWGYAYVKWARMGIRICPMGAPHAHVRVRVYRVAAVVHHLRGPPLELHLRRVGFKPNHIKPNQIKSAHNTFSGCHCVAYIGSVLPSIVDTNALP